MNEDLQEIKDEIKFMQNLFERLLETIILQNEGIKKSNELIRELIYLIR